jgi:hypothetical protein
MKTRRILYLAIVAAVLSLAIALPALADEPIEMWVQRNRMAWTGRSYSTSDAVVAKIHIFDATRAMVPGATVTAMWSFDGDDIGQATSVTGSRGIAEFIRPATRGRYQICVIDVVRDRWQYNAGLNMDSECSAINVW